MVNKSKAKGTAFEVLIRNGLREAGLDVERLVLNGSADEGDLVIKNGITTIAELKAEQKIDLPRYLRELAEERANYAKHRKLDPDAIDGVVIVKRRGANWKDCYVVTTVADYFNLEGKDA